MKHGDIKQDDNGKYIWRQPEGTIGWWRRVEDEEITKHRVPLSCPSCEHLIDNWSHSFYNRRGVCSNCYYDFLHDRPGLPEMDNVGRAAYCKQKFKNSGEEG